MIVLLFACLAVIAPPAAQDLGAQELQQELQAAHDYLFSPEEQQRFAQLRTLEAQTQFWDDYWRRNDPTPATEYNEWMLEFLRRFQYTYFFDTNNVFADGWKQDMGRVYILFGPPREIVRSPFGPSSGTKTEVWIYRLPGDEGRSVELVFEDRDDLGRYLLKTKVKFPRDISLDPRLPEIIESGVN